MGSKDHIEKAVEPRENQAGCHSHKITWIIAAWIVVVATTVGSEGARSIDGDIRKTRKEAARATEQGSGIKISVIGENWGTGQHQDIKAVLTSATKQMTSHMREVVVADINIMRHEGDPETRRGKSGPTSYQILLSAQDTYWAQYSYQFGHELCHVLTNYEQRFQKPNQWFEETICEAAALFTVRRMSQAWKDDPPYPNWTDYAEELEEYADKMATEVAGISPDDEAWTEWLGEHEECSRTNPYQRVGNRTIAVQMLPLFEQDPEGWNAIRKLPASEAEIEKFMAQWKESVDRWDVELVEKIEKRLHGTD